MLIDIAQLVLNGVMAGAILAAPAIGLSCSSTGVITALKIAPGTSFSRPSNR